VVTKLRLVDSSANHGESGSPEGIASGIASNDPGALQLPTELGAYRVEEMIGEGGMGIVYRAEHIQLRRKVALKLLRPELATDPNAVRRFFAEARAVNCIEHDNLVAITDITEQPCAHYIMELLKGDTLADRIEARGGFLPLDEALDICGQVASVLAALHNAEIVHCDIKPENVFLIQRDGRDNFVKLIDFGVAILPDEERTAGMAGTPAYMAPEQAAGEKLDHRVDIYALGVMLYQLVSGQLPFRAQQADDMAIQHLTVIPPPPSTLENKPQAIPEAVDELVATCLGKKPEQRFQSAHELEFHIRRIRDQLREAARSATLRERFRRVPLPVTLGVAALLAISTAVALLWLPGGDDSAQVGDAVALTVTFNSNPPGAAVRDERSKKTLGTTPFTTSLNPSQTPRRFRFQLDGYSPKIEEIMLADNVIVSTTLKQLAPKKKRRAKASKQHPARKPKATAQPATNGKGKKKPTKPRRTNGKKSEKTDAQGLVNPFD